MRKKAILLVENSAELRELLTVALAGRYTVDTARSFAEAQSEGRHPRHAAFIVDIERGGPEDEGLKLMAALRGDGDERPLIAISGRREPEIPSLCYEAGADAFVAKSVCTVRELRAVLRRLLALPKVRGARARVDGIRLPERGFWFAGAMIDPMNMTGMFPRGLLQHLNPKEIGILHVFALGAGRLVRRGEILAHVWGPTAVPTSKTLDTYLVRLRRAYERGGLDLTKWLKVKPKVGWWVQPQRRAA